MEAVTRRWYESRTGTWITFGTLISLYGEKLYTQRLMLRPRQQTDTEIQELQCFNVVIILLFLSLVLVMFYVISCITSILFMSFTILLFFNSAIGCTLWPCTVSFIVLLHLVLSAFTFCNFFPITWALWNRVTLQCILIWLKRQNKINLNSNVSLKQAHIYTYFLLQLQEEETFKDSKVIPLKCS